MQSSTEVQAEIDGLQAQLEPLLAEMDQLMASFAASLPGVAEPWIRHHVQSQIEDNQELVAAMPDVRLRAFKADVEKVIAELPVTCQRAVEQTSTQPWPHRPPDTS